MADAFVMFQHRRVSTGDAFKLSPDELAKLKQKEKAYSYVDPLEILIPTEEEDEIRMSMRTQNSELHVYLSSFTIGCILGVFILLFMKYMLLMMYSAFETIDLNWD